jgi:GTP-binding protein
MKPILVLVGRTNVGKSTLFNRLTRSRDAIVADAPGLTRDRHYGHGRVGIKPFLVVDTGGFEPAAKSGILAEMAKQTEQAIAEGDKILFMVDARQGLHAGDKIIAESLRKSGRPLWLVVNKAEGMARDIAAAEFFELGLGNPLPISAEHGEGVNELIELVLAGVPPAQQLEEQRKHPKIAIVGRPNAGKSTLVNTLLGEERVIVFGEPGTTRDSIYVDFERAGKNYTLIDTAGLRKRGKVHEAVEKFSTIKALQAVEDANVVVLVLDAQQDIAEQDAHIAGFILEAGRALVLAVNKWDGLSAERRDRIKNDMARKLRFLDFAKVHYISALQGKGVGTLLKSVDAAYRAAMTKLATPKLTRALQSAIARQQPPRTGLIRPKLRYAHQGGMNPPLVVIHGNALNHVPESYRRYLEGALRKVFKLQGTPLKVQFKHGRNPYAGK